MGTTDVPVSRNLGGGRMTSASLWVQGARPRTLGAAVAPVLVGTAAAVAEVDGVIWWRAALAMVVALALQVGVNYANDYSDGVRGTDKDRKGPVRLTATGLATPGAVQARRVPRVRGGRGRGPGARRSSSNPWLLLVGVAAIAAAWLYTGGPKPYGYLGLGEVMVLVFFGFVATVGSAYVQIEEVPSAAWWGSLVVGLLACAILARQQRARHPDRRGRRASARSRCASVRHRGAAPVRRLLRGIVPRGGRRSASRNRGRSSACSRCRSRSRRCARSCTRTDPPSLVAVLVQTSKLEARGRGAGERGPVPVLSEHRLRLGDARGDPGRGSGGLGRVLAARRATRAIPRRCRAAAEEAARDGFPPACATSVPVNALVDGPFVGAGRCAAIPAVKVKVRDAAGRRAGRARCATRSGRRRRCGSTPTARGTSTPRSTMIARLARYDLEFVEQPVATLDDLARVRRRVDVPVAADECIRSLDDARRLRALDAADVIVLKQQPLGGVRAALAVAEAAGVPAVVTSMMETSVGIAAGVALAAALPELPYACGPGHARRRSPATSPDDPLVPVDGVLRGAAGRARRRPARALRGPGGEQVSDAPPAARGGTRDRRPRAPRRARRGIASAMRWAISTYFASSSPAISSTGMRELAQSVPVRRLRALPEHAQLVR